MVTVSGSKGQTPCTLLLPQVTEAVEEWLTGLGSCMVVSLQHHLASHETSTPRGASADVAFRSLPSQLACLAEAISFCEAAE